ncbi:hypothetical protein WJX72_007859 [[Myrmecia] bisecta]|uniref:Uncharacterized protein n=1 Tax=[Myrmecia] bisecta TaxID=41462 RepID=A0AAW1Q3F7_9CHLO
MSQNTKTVLHGGSWADAQDRPSMEAQYRVFGVLVEHLVVESQLLLWTPKLEPALNLVGELGQHFLHASRQLGFPLLFILASDLPLGVTTTLVEQSVRGQLGSDSRCQVLVRGYEGLGMSGNIFFEGIMAAYDLGVGGLGCFDTPQYSACMELPASLRQLVAAKKHMPKALSAG